MDELSVGKKAIELFKQNHFEASLQYFDKFLSANQSDKVGFSNRAAALLKLNRYPEAMADADKCIRLDPRWAKGYKRKADALEGLGKKREAMEVLLDANKLCTVGTHIFDDQLLRLNDELGEYIGDFRKNRRRQKEKWCVFCDCFEEGQLFVSCDMCAAVHYCCEEHQLYDADRHHNVCGVFCKQRQRREQGVCVIADWNLVDGNLPCVALIRFMQTTQKKQPLVGIDGFKAVSVSERQNLCSWDLWFSLPQFRDLRTAVETNERDCIDQIKEFESTVFGQQAESLASNLLFYEDPQRLGADLEYALKEALTDPLTLFYAMRRTKLWHDNASVFQRSGNDFILRIHVAGTEEHEFVGSVCFRRALTGLFGDDPPRMHIEYVGILLSAGPDQNRNIPDAEIRITTSHFRGSYQDYLGSIRYKAPHCIMLFSPGLYDITYSWLSVIAHAISQNIPLVATCFSPEDYSDTQRLLVHGRGLYGMAPNIALDCVNPFADGCCYQSPVGSNQFKCRNQFVIVVHGGSLGYSVEQIASNGCCASEIQSRFRNDLRSKGSHFDFEDFCSSLRWLHQQGKLVVSDDKDEQEAQAKDKHEENGYL